MTAMTGQDARISPQGTRWQRIFEGAACIIRSALARGRRCGRQLRQAQGRGGSSAAAASPSRARTSPCPRVVEPPTGGTCPREDVPRPAIIGHAGVDVLVAAPARAASVRLTGRRRRGVLIGEEDAGPRTRGATPWKRGCQQHAPGSGLWRERLERLARAADSGRGVRESRVRPDTMATTSASWERPAILAAPLGAVSVRICAVGGRRHVRRPIRS